MKKLLLAAALVLGLTVSVNAAEEAAKSGGRSNSNDAYSVAIHEAVYNLCKYAECEGRRVEENYRYYAYRDPKTGLWREVRISFNANAFNHGRGNQYVSRHDQAQNQGK